MKALHEKRSTDREKPNRTHRLPTTANDSRPAASCRHANIAPSLFVGGEVRFDLGATNDFGSVVKID
jgi:hypothetical protein